MPQKKSKTQGTEYRFHLNKDMTRYVERMKARIGITGSAFFCMCIEFFWTQHPAGSSMFLLEDTSKRIYTIVEVLDTGIPVLRETDSYTCRSSSLLATLRERYPTLNRGDPHVFSRKV